jgi:hypothetical protein
VFEALFAQHDDTGDCRLYDQLSHADGVGFGYVEPGALAPLQQPPPALPKQLRAAQAAGYLARGPPGTA